MQFHTVQLKYFSFNCTLTIAAHDSLLACQTVFALTTDSEKFSLVSTVSDYTALLLRKK